MIPRPLSFLRDPSARRPLMLFAFFGVLAAGVGFVFVSPRAAGAMIVAGGYYFILTLFAAFLVYAWRVARPRRAIWQAWLRRPGWIGLALLGAVAFAVWSDHFKHKILFDEYVLQGTAWQMHATKEIGTPLRAFDFAGTWLTLDTFLDKRPFFFTFLLSLVHDLIGFRLENVYALNVLLAAVVLGLTYWLARTLTGRIAPALLAVALLATMPLFGQNATGAGLELHNLAMIAVVMTCAILYLRAPDGDRLSLLVLGAVLLAESRYESVLFVFSVAAVAVLGWRRAGRIILPPAALVAPLLLVPYAWHDRFVSAQPVLWQLREGDTARFGWRYLAGNLEGAERFFFGVSPLLPNSLWLTLLGLAGVLWALWCGVRKIRERSACPAFLSPATTVLALFGAVAAANLALLMFYYWSRLDEPIAARFALPFYFMLALLAAWLVRSLDARRLPATRVAAIGLGVWLVVWAVPAYAKRLYTTQNLVMQEIEWELGQVTAERRPLLLITNKAVVPFLLEKISAINIPMAIAETSRIAWHVDHGTFPRVLVSQVLRPTSAKGEIGVDPDDVLPENFVLEPLVTKRFGARWIRISRLREIRPAGKDRVPEATAPSRS